MPDKPTSAEIYQVAEKFKQYLLAMERKSAGELIRYYGRSYKRMAARIRALTKQIDDARRSGTIISPSWLFQIQRYQDLMRQIQIETERFADVVEKNVIRSQIKAGKAGIRDAAAIGNASIEAADLSVSFSTLNPSAVESMAGFLADGSPLRSLLDRMPAKAAESVNAALVEAVTLGYNPTKTARNIRYALGGNLNRALTIARTETLRAYREATYQSNLKNGDISAGWIWVASYSRRTCASCLALAGSFHPLSERMESHPRCRCTQMMLVKGLPLRVEKGEDWFAKQPDDVKRDILGTRAGLDAYNRGELTLTDFVGRQNNPQWGNSFYQISVAKAKQKQGQFPGYNRPERDTLATTIETLGGMHEQ